MIKTKKPVKRGSIRVVKRGKLIGDFTDQAKHMTKQQLIDHMATINRPDNSTYIISKRFLNRIYGMSEEDIRQAIEKSKSEVRFRQDLKSYYNGKLSSNDIISKWKSRGIETQSDVDILATRDIYDITGKFNDPKKIKEHFAAPATIKKDVLAPQPHTVMATAPTGQRSFITNGYSLYTTYREMKQYLEREVRNGKMTEQMKDHYLTSYLLDIATRRPEFAAHIAYILAGKDMHDDMEGILAAFRGSFGKAGLKDKFVHMIKMYKLQRSRDPEYQQKLQERLQNLDMKSKLGFTDPYTSKKKVDTISTKSDKYLNMDPEIIDRVENTDYGRQDRKRKRSKIVPKRKVKKSIKRVVKKTIRRVPIKCRCK